MNLDLVSETVREDVSHAWRPPCRSLHRRGTLHGTVQYATWTSQMRYSSPGTVQDLHRRGALNGTVQWSTGPSLTWHSTWNSTIRNGNFTEETFYLIKYNTYRNSLHSRVTVDGTTSSLCYRNLLCDEELSWNSTIRYRNSASDSYRIKDSLTWFCGSG